MTMTETIRTIASLSDKKQTEFYNGLRAVGFSEVEISNIQSMVFYHKLFEDKSFYKAVESSLCETIYNEMRAKA